MKQIIHILCSIALIINLSLMSVVHYHHHDCSGNIHIKLAHTYELALNSHAVEKCDDEHGQHSHHSHPCEDNCSLSSGNIMPAELQHEAKFVQDQKSIDVYLSAVIPETELRLQNTINDYSIQYIHGYSSDYNLSSFLLRGPPSLLYS